MINFLLALLTRHRARKALQNSLDTAGNAEFTYTCPLCTGFATRSNNLDIVLALAEGHKNAFHSKGK